MKIIIIGLGSIGQRHFFNLKKIYPRADFYALRKKNKSTVIKDTNIIKNKNFNKIFKFKILKNYNQAKKLRPDLVFICNPTSFHYRDVKFFIQNKTNIFIEKPLIADINKIKKLIIKIKKFKVNTMVGYQLRFHPIIKLVKKLIKNQKYGRVVSANFKNLSYLPNYHPYEDYSKSYASKKNRGGGVINTSSHEIDLIAYFFGMPKKIQSINIKSGNIKCDTEDIINCNFLYNKPNYFFVNLELSFLHYLEKRFFYIVFKKAILKADLLNSRIEIFSNKNKKKIFSQKFKIKKNELFIKELNYMRLRNKNNKKNFLSIENNLSTIKLINKIKQFSILNNI